MSTNSKNESLKEQTKRLREEYVIDTAASLFIDQGLEQTTMDEIAKEAGLSKTTIYTMFKSKEDLEILVYQRIHSEKMIYFKEQVEKCTTPLDRLKAFCEAYHDFFHKNPKHLQFQLKHDYLGMNNEKLSPEILDGFQEFFKNDIDFVIEIYKAGMNEGVFRTDIDPNIALDSLYLTMRAVLNQTILFNPDVTMNTSSQPEGKFHAFLDIYLKGLMTNENKKDL